MRTVPVTLAVALFLSTPVIGSAQSQTTGAKDIHVGSGRTGEVVTLDFTSGSLGDLFDKIMKVAKGSLFVALFIGLFLEAFGKPPGAPREFGAVAWRLVVVLFLLGFYHQVFGTIINFTDYLAEKVSPTQVAVAAYMEARWKAERDALDAGLSGPAQPPSPDMVATAQRTLADPNASQWSKDFARKVLAQAEAAQEAGPAPKAADESLTGKVVSGFVGGFYDGILTLLFAITGSVRFIVERLGRILTSLFYLLGPLALVFSIPRPSGSGGAWFRYFLTVASWPIFTGLLMSVLVHMSVQINSDSGLSHAAAMASALVFAVTMFAAPLLANVIIAGSLASVASAGLGAAQGATHSIRRVSSLVAGAATGGAAAAAGAAASAAGGKALGSAASRLVANPPDGRP